MPHDSFALPSPEPMHSAEHAEAERHEYLKTVDRLAFCAIYRDWAVKAVKEQMDIALKNPAFVRLEETHHELGALLQFIQGINAHEEADTAYGGWQNTLNPQSKQTRIETPKKASELPTREEVAKKFAAYPQQNLLLDREHRALQHYTACLTLRPNFEIQLTDNVSLNAKDIRTLMLDLQTRQAERIAKDSERTTSLHRLDEAYKNLIDEFSKAGDRGKQDEARIIYLFRRLMHAADTGYLGSVTHGTPREDLRPERGNVDIRVIAAGKGFALQVKAFNSGAKGNAKAIQYQSWDRAAGKDMKNTHLVRVENHDLAKCFDAAIDQSDDRLTYADKLETLNPLLETMEAKRDTAFLTALGFTETALRKEQETLTAANNERKRLEAERIRLEAERQEKIAAADREYKAQQQRERATQEVNEIVPTVTQEDLQLIEQTRRKEADERFAKENARKQTQQLARIQAIEQKAQEKELAKKRKEAAQKGHETKKQREREKRTLKEIAWPAMLVRLGFLPAGWKFDAANPQPFLAAKERFIQLFADQRAKSVRGSEVDVNDAFQDLFPSDEDVQNPSPETLQTIKILLEKK